MSSPADDDWSGSDEERPSVDQMLDELCRMIVVIRAGPNSEHIQFVEFKGFEYTANSEFLCRVENDSEPKWIAERDLSLDLLVQLRSAGVQFAVDKQAHRDEVDSSDEKDNDEENKDSNGDDDLYTVLSASKRRPEVTLCLSARYWPEIRGKNAGHARVLRKKLTDLSFPAPWEQCTGVLRREYEYDYWVTESCAADLFHVDGVAGAEQRLSLFMVDAFRDAYKKLVPREVQKGIDLPTPVVFTKGVRSKVMPSTVDQELAALVEASKRRMETAKSKDSPTKKSTARSKATPSKPVRTKVTPVKSRSDTKLAASIRRLQSAGKRLASDSETENESTPVQRSRKRPERPVSKDTDDEPTPSNKKRSRRDEILDEQPMIKKLGALKAPHHRANVLSTPALEPIQRVYHDTQEDRKIIDLGDDDDSAIDIDDRQQSDETTETNRTDIEASTAMSLALDNVIDLPSLIADSESPSSHSDAAVAIERATIESSSFTEIDHISAYRSHSPLRLRALAPVEANDSTVSPIAESKDNEDEDLIETFINTLPRAPLRRSLRRSPMRDEQKMVHDDADESTTASPDMEASSMTLTPVKRRPSRAMPDRSPSSDSETRSMAKKFTEIPVTGVVLIPRQDELDFPNDSNENSPPPKRTNESRASWPTARGGVTRKSRQDFDTIATRNRKGNH